ncbi:uncharacterized protein AMSG_05142 [Thecamonas trahens ATCC 50062]|uniref:BHLH domain-containing protein n=1 Tax=Thecamonas trahens ATCC 50062 TaxID=461836 RepID=A0A0L0D9Z5_THETB|nr:hypothetical protein AMSG_05142 [Thecamonas trahens ATCC 50062]KNC49164.1 hypothetical protein AMSG_05142 [Thecamonas trahens ATCC 50062]|eukprot:XP_013758185.1 hypothetical protein AMSG_05142 [Thecamonas trahens ATCC 50062]
MSSNAPVPNTPAFNPQQYYQQVYMQQLQAQMAAAHAAHMAQTGRASETNSSAAAPAAARPGEPQMQALSAAAQMQAMQLAAPLMVSMANAAQAAQVQHERKGKVRNTSRRERASKAAPYTTSGLQPGRKLSMAPLEPETAQAATSALMDQKSRREYHKRAEKKRRLKINELVQQLRSLLPNPSKVAFQKPTVFQHVANYVKALKAHRTFLEDELARTTEIVLDVQTALNDRNDYTIRNAFEAQNMELNDRIVEFKPSLARNPDIDYNRSPSPEETKNNPTALLRKAKYSAVSSAAAARLARGRPTARTPVSTPPNGSVSALDTLSSAAEASSAS